MVASQSPIQLVIIAACAWFAYRLWKSPTSPALWAVVACLVTRYLASGGITDLRDWFGGPLAHPAVAKVAMNATLSMSWCALLLFFLFAAAPQRVGRTAAREVAVMAAVVCTMAAMVALTPNADQAFASGSGGTLPTNFSTSMAVFYLVGSSYNGYVTWRGAWWAWCYAAESTERTRFGLRAAAVALGIIGSVAAIRAVQTLLTWIGYGLPNWVSLVNQGVPVGITLFVLGVCLAGATARIGQVRIWARHRRALRELQPLWTVLHELFPEDRLVPAHEKAVVDRFAPRQVHKQFWRTVVEIRDGLVQLSPYLADTGYTPDMSLAYGDLLREALHRAQSGEPPSSREAVLVAAPCSNDVEAEVDQLVTLSRSLA